MSESLDAQLEVLSIVYADCYTKVYQAENDEYIIYLAVTGDTTGLPLRPDVVFGKSGLLATLSFRVPVTKWSTRASLVAIESSFDLNIPALVSKISTILSDQPISDFCGAISDIEECVRTSAWQLQHAETLLIAKPKLEWTSNVDEAVMPTPSSQVHISCVLGRQFCYSHHIRSPEKRRCIVRWANDAQLHGCSKIGYPGYIIIEGPLALVDDYVKRLARLRWAKFVARCRQVIESDCSREDHTGSGCEKLNEMMKLPCPFLELDTTAAGELARICKESGLNDFFRAGLRLD
eukprot:Gregarina_sp_Poly_1__6385@NODE_3401_length_1121_cov_131_143264_g2119_i1_p1_GENE_NODE_3401_length_1121_cov_131_143264_g2119_i1NODE_3401_length_1121_cov_131_143264_g2119_i1_p1_ORF_typecomplete_len292_score21_67DUF1115/PF06544_12/2_8e17_NODE_3401_length_1121_cov_131_143264_g2119_i12211096